MPSSSLLVLAADGPRLAGEDDALDLIAEAGASGASRVAVPLGRFDPAFFDLANGKAGAFTQKLVNYGLRLAIVGDMAPFTAESKPLGDFIGECNRGRQIWFVDDMDELYLRRARAGEGSHD